MREKFTLNEGSLICIVYAMLNNCDNNDNNSAAPLKCDSYEFESLLAGYVDKGSVHYRGGQGM